MAGLHFAAKKFPNAGEMRLGSDACVDGRSTGREFVEDRDVKIAIERELERAWNGRAGEDQDVRGMAVGSGFVHEAFALQDAETVLLVDGRETEAREFDLVFDEGVGADDQLGFT